MWDSPYLLVILRTFAHFSLKVRFITKTFMAALVTPLQKEAILYSRIPSNNPWTIFTTGQLYRQKISEKWPAWGERTWGPKLHPVQGWIFWTMIFIIFI